MYSHALALDVLGGRCFDVVVMTTMAVTPMTTTVVAEAVEVVWPFEVSLPLRLGRSTKA
jgi:hypothetical protein